ncbi:MAG: hypothetical protein DRQ51_04335 [Gammaproteobacteria bacterium]|nr:MAG: hypothetical protein DRQ51_04335 [Gammaproteobacteria bacterium]
MHKDITIKAISDFLGLILSIVILSIVTKNLGTIKYGVFSQVVTTITLLVPVLLIRLNTASVRYFPIIIKDKIKIKEKFISILLIISGLSFVVSLGIYFNKDTVAKLIFDDISYSYLILYLSIYIFVRAILTYLIDFYRSINKTKYSSVFIVTRFFFIFLSIIVTLTTSFSIVNVLVAYITSEVMLIFVIFTILFQGYFKNIKTYFNFSGLKPYFLYSIPLVPYSILISINQLGDRFFITHFLGIDKAGIYTFSYNLIGAAFMINTAIAYVIYPYISQMWANNNKKKVKKYLEKGQNMFLYFAIPIIAGLFVLYPDLIVIIAGDEFEIGRELILLIALGYIFLGIYGINGYIIDLSQKTTFFLVILIISATTNMILNFVLIPIYGIAGAAFSTFVTYFIQAVIMYFIAQKLVGFKIDINFYFIFVCLLSTFVMLITMSFIKMDNVILQLITSFVAGVAIYLGLTYFLLLKRKKLNIYNLLED